MATNGLKGRVNRALLICLLAALVLGYVVFHFFILIFVVAASAALLLQPIQTRLSRRLGQRPGLSAALLVLAAGLLILAPVLTYGTLVARQASGFVEWLRPRVQPEYLDRLVHETLPERFPALAPWIDQTDASGTGVVSALLSRVGTVANAVGQDLLAGLASAIVDGLLFLMMLFFLLRDGPQLREAVRGISPLTSAQEGEMIGHLTNTVRGVLQALILVPLAQGLLAFLGFLVFGVPAPGLWAVIVVLAAMIPLVGSPLGWVPAGVYLLMTGATGAGVGMLLYGALVISTSDNVIKPLILQGAANIHTLPAFLSIFGGILAFGPKGVVVGPVILSLVISAYRIYRFDILKRQDEGPQEA